MIPNKKY